MPKSSSTRSLRSSKKSVTSQSSIPADEKKFTKTAILNCFLNYKFSPEKLPAPVAVTNEVVKEMSKVYTTWKSLKLKDLNRYNTRYKYLYARA